MIQMHYQIAIKFAGEKHKDQLVPGANANYLLHLSNVAMEVMIAHQQESNFDLSIAVQLALLHDTVEDTDTTSEEIMNSFGRKIAEGVAALSKNPALKTKAEKMDDSLRRILDAYPEVRLVKMADRITNLQEPPHYWTKEKIKQYTAEAQKIFDQLSGINTYLDQRLQQQIEAYKTYWKE
ncbi:MAG: HD domain-containing protein [Bacteroidota bacterium]